MSEEKTTIMVIDDDPFILEMLQQVIGDCGYRVLTCDSAKNAMHILRTQEVKLALIDICMPEVSGVELLRQIQQVRPSTHVIMITGLSDVEIAQECMELGAVDFITKPFDMDYLQTSVFVEIISRL